MAITNQDRVGKARGLQVEQRAKTAQTSHRAGPLGAARGGLDPSS
mgnify:CR=1 FL=1